MDVFSHTLSTFCQSSSKWLGITKLSDKLTIAGHLLFSIVSSVKPRTGKKETCKTTEQLLSLL